MSQTNTKDLTTLPVGRLGLIPLISCKDLGEKVNDWLIQWRKERSHDELGSFAFEGYQRDSYLLPVQTARFGSGEAKCTILESVRGLKTCDRRSQRKGPPNKCNHAIPV